MQQSTFIKLLLAGLVNGIVVPFCLYWVMEYELTLLLFFIPGFSLVTLNFFALSPTYQPKHSFLQMSSYSIGISTLSIIILFGSWSLFSQFENLNLYYIFTGLVLFPILIQFFHLHFNTQNDKIALTTAALIGVSTFLMINPIFNIPQKYLQSLHDFIEKYAFFQNQGRFPEYFISYFWFSIVFNLLLFITNLSSKYRTVICVIFVLAMFGLLIDFS